MSRDVRTLVGDLLAILAAGALDQLIRAAWERVLEELARALAVGVRLSEVWDEITGEAPSLEAQWSP